MSDLEIPAKPAFDISRVFNRTFGAIKQNFKAFFLASFFIVGLPQFVLGLWPMMAGLSGGDGTIDIENMIVMIVIIGGVSGLIIMVLQFLLQGAIIHSSIGAFNGQKISFRESIATAMRYFWPMVGFGLLATLGVLGGMLIFIIPGIILALMWAVGIPAMITEDKRVGEAFGRSSELTDGYKWWLLLLFLIIGIISGIISAVGSVAMASFGGDMQEVLITGTSVSGIYWLVNALVQALVQLFSVMVSAVGSAAVYYELRYLKEGIGPQSIASVFD